MNDAQDILNDYTGLPSPWVFDGVRRLYRSGKLADGEKWVARAVDINSRTLAEPESEWPWRMALRQGFGHSPIAAVENLLEQFEDE